MLYRYLIATVVVAVISVVSCQQQGIMSRIPGGQTAAGILASAADGGSRYLAQDGPIQPAITAISGAPMRAAEQLNGAVINRLSSGLGNQAQSLSQAAGQNGQYRMPGLDTAESHMPQAFANLGQQAHGMIQKKNRFIMGQADEAIRAANNLGNMMHKSMSVRSSTPMQSMHSMMEGPAKMMSSAQDFMTKSLSDIQNQAKQHLNGAMSRMGTMQDMGKDVMGQMQGYSSTIQNGVHGTMGQLHQTGQQLMSQVQNNHQKNMNSMTGMMGSLHGSMGKMGSNMQKNMDGVMQHAQSTAHQLTEGLQKVAHQAAEAPMKVMSSLMDGLGSMMKGKGGGSGHSSSGGRY